MPLPVEADSRFLRCGLYLQSQADGGELLSTICVEFGIAYPAGNTSVMVFVDCINVYLLDAHARGRHTVLIIDEAQNLSAEVLEQMRLLTNLETDQRKLLQIILLGQPEFATMLERPELRQLRQRIVARYHLGPLGKAEVAAYVRHRLEVAGAQRQLFPERLLGRVYRLSGGVPRVINVLCDRALLGAYVQSKERVDAATLAQAAREVLHQPAAWRGRLRARGGRDSAGCRGACARAVLKEQGNPSRSRCGRASQRQWWQTRRPKPRTRMPRLRMPRTWMPGRQRHCPKLWYGPPMKRSAKAVRWHTPHCSAPGARITRAETLADGPKFCVCAAAPPLADWMKCVKLTVPQCCCCATRKAGNSTRR
jgi:hypothetical protein